MDLAMDTPNKYGEANHDLIFMSKTNRDAAYALLKEKGVKPGKRTSTRSQELHPMYVFDYEAETGVKLTPADKGFGNTIYKTYFPRVYHLRWYGPALEITFTPNPNPERS